MPSILLEKAPDRFSYTSGKDYEAIRAEIVELIPTLTDTWTDFNSSDVGITMVEILAYVHDAMSFYLDHQAGEAFIDRAKERKNIFSHANLIGYRPHGITGAIANLQLTKVGSAVAVPAYTKFTTVGNSGVISYYTIADFYKAAVDDSVTFPVVEGELRTDTGFTTIEQRQVYTEELGANAGTFLIFDGLDVWTRRDFSQLNQELPINGKWYEVYINYEGKLYLEFNPAIDFSQYEFDITYLVSNGLDSKVGASTITVSPDILDVAVTNPEQAAGGSGEEKNSDIIRNSLELLKSFFTGVTLNDIEVVMKTYPGIAKVKAADYNVDPAIELLTVDVFVVPDDLGTVTTALIEALTTFLDSRRVVTVHTRVKAPEYIDLDINMQISLLPSFTFGIVEAEIRSQFELFFSLENAGLDFGQDIYFSNLVTLAQNVQGVSQVEFTTPTGNTAIAFNQFPRLNSLVITLGA